MKVSVLVLPDASPAHFAEALQSVAMQYTDFTFEIVTGDDGSGSVPVDVLSGYGSRFSFQVIPLRPPSAGPRLTSVVLWDLLRTSRGEYISLLRASDLWLTDDKVLAQSAFLDEREDCAATFHAVTPLSDEAPTRCVAPLAPGRDLVTADDLLGTRALVAPSSMMFRRSALPCLPAWVHELRCPDRAVVGLVAARGDLGYLPDVLGATRALPGSDGGSRVNDLMSQLELHHRLTDVLGPASYESLVYARSKLRALIAVERCVPAAAGVVVVTEGDDEFLDLGQRPAQHLMLYEDSYAGHHPEDDRAALGALDEARARGAEYLVVPANAFWWLSQYPQWAWQMVTTYRCIWADDDVMVVQFDGAGAHQCG